MELLPADRFRSKPYLEASSLELNEIKFELPVLFEFSFTAYRQTDQEIENHFR